MDKLIYQENGIYKGVPKVMEAISALSSRYGILNFQLYKKVLKEYNRNKSIYHLEHNDPHLLVITALGMVNKCDQYSEYEGIPFDIPSIYTSLNHLEINIPYDLYPGPHSVIWEDIQGLKSTLISYCIDRGDLQPGKLDTRLVYLFYSDWEYNTLDVISWVNKALALLNTLPVNTNIKHNLLSRGLDSLSKEDNEILRLNKPPRDNFSLWLYKLLRKVKEFMLL